MGIEPAEILHAARAAEYEFEDHPKRRVKSNDDVSKLGLYAGVAGGVFAVGAALAVSGKGSMYDGGFLADLDRLEQADKTPYNKDHTPIMLELNYPEKTGTHPDVYTKAAATGQTSPVGYVDQEMEQMWDNMYVKDQRAFLKQVGQAEALANGTLDEAKPLWKRALGGLRNVRL